MAHFGHLHSSEMHIFPRSGDDHSRGSYDFKFGQIPNKTENFANV